MSTWLRLLCISLSEFWVDDRGANESRDLVTTHDSVTCHSRANEFD